MQSENHKAVKQFIASLLLLAGYLFVAVEHLCSDIVGIKRKSGEAQVDCLEYERSAKNCVRNSKRNHAHGADRTLLICPNEAVKKAVKNKISRELPKEVREKTYIALLSDVTAEHLRVWDFEKV